MKININRHGNLSIRHVFLVGVFITIMSVAFIGGMLYLQDINPSTTNSWFGTITKYETITIDECEYLRNADFPQYNPSHKGDCKNLIHPYTNRIVK